MRKGYKQRQWHRQRHPRGFRAGHSSRFGKAASQGIFRSRHGIIMGVCKGISESFNFSVFWVRVIFVITFFFSGLWPVIGIYLAGAFLMKPRPVKPLETEEEKDFYNNYVNSRAGAVRTLKSRFDSLERRIRRMEDTVTTREFEWDRKMSGEQY
ncbi:phage shock protein C (PspC) family protein [Desulfocicer vacuolatum DSM 3385]|uniref:Phage shock protein C (PspC) family protein n=1 Tax=Desulfocicer vacuolatum DSM 3385 TaxID=1121400 RepID=A0A1W2AWI9_9BACT|nr:envelope stress response membrane protein PspC [Desulfocicer vacuolatum]SMC64984.1 phage shock protein C (PspC) family protein [Desulfocicer vacuolatum DSM 3385]